MGWSVAALVSAGEIIWAAEIVWSAISSYVIIAAGALYGNYQSKMMASKARQAGLADLVNRKTMFKQPITVHRYVYGKVRISGPTTFIDTTNIAGVTPYQYHLYILITLAAHEVHAIDDVYFGDQRVELDNSGNARGKYKNFVVIHKGLGTTAGDADLNAYLSAAFPEKWTANHLQEGRAKLLVRLTYSAAQFPEGVPNISAVVRGKKVYDPRTLTSYYTTNPALCMRDYIVGEYGLVAGDGIEHSGTAQAGASGTITLATGASASDDAYNYMTARALAGTGAGQERRITDYVGSSKVATVEPDWTTPPDATTVYEITSRDAELNDTSFADAADVCEEEVDLTGQNTGFVVHQESPLLEDAPERDYTQNPTGTLPSGNYYYAVTYTDAIGETTLGKISSETWVGEDGDGLLHGIAIKKIPVGPAGVTGRKLYRSAESPGAFYLCGTLADNTATTYTDDGSITGAAAPTVNTAAFSTILDMDFTQPIISDYQKVTLSSTGTLPAPFASATPYYFISHGEKRGELASSRANALAGTPITPTSTGSAVRNTGVAQGGSSTTITLAGGASAVDDYYVDMNVTILTGIGVPLGSQNGVQRRRRIIDYDGTTKVATIDDPWTINPTTGSVYQITDAHYITRSSEPRYSLDGLLDTDATPKNILESMLTCCAGKMLAPGGQWYLYPGSWRAPTLTFDENDLDGNIKVTTRLSKRDLCNGVKGVYIDAGNKWEPTDFPPVTNATYTTEDNEERIWRDLLLPYTISSSAAQRIAKIELERTRQQITTVWPCKLTALRAQVGDVVSLTNTRFGWSDKPFEIMNLNFVIRQDGDAPRLGVELVMRETASGVYDWNSGEETTVDLAPDTNLPDPVNLPAPVGLAAESGTEQLYVRNDGTVISRIKLSWTPYADDQISSGGYIEVEYRLTTSQADDWEKWGSVPGSESSVYIQDVSDGSTYYVRIRAVGLVKSPWSAAIYHIVVGKTEPPPDVDTFNVQRLGDGTRRYSWTYDNPPADLSGFIIRYRPGTGYTWDEMYPLHTGVLTASPFESNALAAGTYTLAIKAVDTTGNLSLNATLTEQTLANPRLGGSILEVNLVEEGWPGAKTNCWVDEENRLWISDSMTWDDFEAAVITWEQWTSWAMAPYLTATYDHTIIDLGSAYTFTPLVSVFGNADYVVEEAHSTDGVTYTGYEFTGLLITARYIKIRVTLNHP